MIEIPPFTVATADWRIHREQLRKVRYQVFVVEQSVPVSEEHDDLDPVSMHAIARLAPLTQSDGQTIGTGRLLADGKIGRMAVLAPWRGYGVGAAILAHLIDAARQQGLGSVALAAQAHAVGFYQRFGFEVFGEPFIEVDIPHRHMRRDIR
jgi:predicted GNAT family N-acyltransferase